MVYNNKIGNNIDNCLTRDRLKKVASLAKIKLSDEEIEYYVKELNVVLTWMNLIAKVNTDGVAPMLHGGCAKIIHNDDIVNDGNIAEQILSGATSEHGCFVVPKSIEQDS